MPCSRIASPPLSQDACLSMLATAEKAAKILSYISAPMLLQLDHYVWRFLCMLCSVSCKRMS